MTVAKKTHWLRTTILVLLICGIAGTALAAFRFRQDSTRTYAAASLQFSFDGAADGLAPNGNAFNVSGLSSEAVLSEALEATGLSGTYTVEQLRDSLAVTASYPGDILEQLTQYDSLLDTSSEQQLRISQYHPTLFGVRLYSDFDAAISREQLEALLKAILEAYRADFARNYAVSLDWLDDRVYVMDQYDYSQQLAIIEEVVNQQARYAGELYQKEPTFRSGGKSFDDMSVRLSNLVDVDIARLNATISMNALSRDTERLLTQYRFSVRDLNRQLEAQTTLKEHLDRLMDGYEKNEIIYLSGADSVTKIDGNSSETYDALVTRRKAVADAITQINARLATIQQRLAELVRVGGSEVQAAAEEMTDLEIKTDAFEEMTRAEIAAAEAAVAQQKEVLELRIAALLAKKNAATDDFRAMLKAFTDDHINERTVRTFNYTYYTPKLLSGAFLVQVVKTAGPICALGFMLCMALLILSRRKEEKGIH